MIRAFLVFILPFLTLVGPQKQKCELAPIELNLGFKNKWQKKITLPTIGAFVVESHYVTDEDFPKAQWPLSSDQGISGHLAASCALLTHKYKLPVEPDCSDVYADSWTRVWTPSEDGNIGQGARGDYIRPDLESEIWQGNMMFRPESFPKMGTKFLLKHKNKTVVVSFGYEIGPGSSKFLGGLTPEVHYYLESSNDATLTIGLLKDQALPLGPVDCSN